MGSRCSVAPVVAPVVALEYVTKLNSDESLYNLITSADTVAAYSSRDFDAIAFTLRFGDSPMLGKSPMWLLPTESSFNVKMYESKSIQLSTLSNSIYFRLLVLASRSLTDEMRSHNVKHIVMLYVGSKYENEFVGNYYISL